MSISITKRVTKSCCGKSAIVMSLDKPITIQHVSLFRDAAFNVPNSYIKCGILYAKKDNFTATATFGICTVNIRCGGTSCDQIISEFESILEKIQKE